jgi:hypothetical protein
MGNLRLLSTVQHERQSLGTGLPSWVPGFHRVFEGWIMGSSRWPYYASGLGPALQWKYVEDQRALDIRGLGFDTIISNLETLSEADFILPDVHTAAEKSGTINPLLKLDAFVSQIDVRTSYPEDSPS